MASPTNGRDQSGPVTIQVSVVIGTCNRAHLLKGTLEALASQVVPTCLKWEIVAVDNNSRDATAQVVAAFSKTTATPVRYVFEPEPGVSRARNRGIKEARGSIIAFTDDDVLPAPDWIAQLLAAFDRWNAHGVGGRILPGGRLRHPSGSRAADICAIASRSWTSNRAACLPSPWKHSRRFGERTWPFVVSSSTALEDLIPNWVD